MVYIKILKDCAYKILKDCAETLAKPLFLIFTESLSSGVVPLGVGPITKNYTNYI